MQIFSNKDGVKKWQFDVPSCEVTYRRFIRSAYALGELRLCQYGSCDFAMIEWEYIMNHES